ncbi:MAG: HD domain-containing protein [Chloroflexota bacterium]
MAIAPLLDLLFHGNQLKRTARTGWAQRGVPNAENVAAHSFGVAFATGLLAQVMEEPVDVGKALTMALLHDLPEGLTSDIPTPAWGYLPAGLKAQVERSAMQEIVGQGSLAAGLMALWEELTAAVTPEARLVHDADKIDLYLQALIYEEQTGNRHLAEFWQDAPVFYFPQARAIYEVLCSRRMSGE